MNSMNAHKFDHLTISIVSHGHRHLIVAFAKQLAKIVPSVQIHLIITVNAVHLEDFDQSSITRNSFSKVTILKNSQSQGFGANHNQAFKHCTTDLFCVVNPDIELLQDPFSNFANAFTDFESWSCLSSTDKF